MPQRANRPTNSRRPSGRRALAALVGLAAVSFAPSPALGQLPVRPTAESVLGTWHGVLKLGPNGLRLVLVVRRDAAASGLVGTLTSVDQGGAQIPAAVAVHGDSLRITAPAAGINYSAALSASRDSLSGVFRQGGVELPLAMGRGALGAPVIDVARPQNPKGPFPYRATDVTVPSVAGVRLAGTLIIPAGQGPFPAVVFVSGSGAQDRDEQLVGHKPFLVLADYLARRGIASLRYDDRGFAKSTGDFAHGTSVDFADDAEAALRFLRNTPGVAADRVGILGHSEGGLIGPMVAARSRDVAFLVLLAGPGVPGDSILLLQNRAIMTANGMSPARVDQQTSIGRQLYSAVATARDSADAERKMLAVEHDVLASLPADQKGPATLAMDGARRQLMSPWMRHFIAYDPRPALRKVKVPVLALNGTLDLQVPYRANLPAIAEALKAGGNRDYQVVELPGLNHLFQTASTGSPSEYATIDETMSPTAMDRVASWIVARFGKK